MDGEVLAILAGADDDRPARTDRVDRGLHRGEGAAGRADVARAGRAHPALTRVVLAGAGITAATVADPPTHRSAVWLSQAWPHVPQLETLVPRFRQTPLQQVSPAPQAVPQFPQWASSVFRGRQIPSQQVSLTPQAAPHVPQWTSSVRVSTSQPSDATSLQSAKPVWQAKPHSPAVQVTSALAKLQTRPQAPQWATSLPRSRHAPAQQVWSLGRGRRCHIGNSPPRSGRRSDLHRSHGHTSRSGSRRCSGCGRRRRNNPGWCRWPRRSPCHSRRHKHRRGRSRSGHSRGRTRRNGSGSFVGRRRYRRRRLVPGDRHSSRSRRSGPRGRQCRRRRRCRTAPHSIRVAGRAVAAAGAARPVAGARPPLAGLAGRARRTATPAVAGVAGGVDAARAALGRAVRAGGGDWGDGASTFFFFFFFFSVRTPTRWSRPRAGFVRPRGLPPRCARWLPPRRLASVSSLETTELSNPASRARSVARRDVAPARARERRSKRRRNPCPCSTRRPAGRRRILSPEQDRDNDWMRRTLRRRSAPEHGAERLQDECNRS